MPGARGQLAELRDNWKSGASVFVAAQREYKEMERKAKEHDYQQSSIGQVDNKVKELGELMKDKVNEKIGFGGSIINCGLSILRVP